MSKRKPLFKKEEDEGFEMTDKNIKICLDNQDRYFTPEINDALELHYYGFYQISNLEAFTNLNTLYLQNNVIARIQNISHMKKLVTINLSNNRITQIQGLEQLTELSILDLSSNKITIVHGLKNNQKLTLLNLANNLMEKPQSIEQLQSNKMLGCLHLSSNPLSNDQDFLKYLSRLNVKTLYMKQTQFSRGTKNYRKQTIFSLKSLTYLDDRPISEQQRLLIEAWKEGGIVKQNQVRKLIQISKQEKNRKTFQQISERSGKVEKLRDELFQKLSHNQRAQLENLKKQMSSGNAIQPEKIKLINNKIQELETFLILFRQDVNYMSVGQIPEVPSNLCERHEPEAIYIYGVSEEQIPKIREKYYPQEERPLIARPFKKDQEVRWVESYSQILEDLLEFQELKENKELLLTIFNQNVHALDQKSNRKARRFTLREMETKMPMNEQTEEGQELNELD